MSDLQIYGGISTEVSNGLFTLHKSWHIYRDYADSPADADDAKYEKAFDLINSGRQAADPIDGVYQLIWKDPTYNAQGGERRTFYFQFMHYWSERMNSVERGWDIFTLLYLHQRQLRNADWATYKDRLGYSQYASRPAANGNDNMVIALSWISKRDMRPIFDMWGVRYSATASSQVASYGFPAEPLFFYGKITLNDYSDVRKVDMTVANPVWPF